ncbi:Predicted dehydrogenase [Caldanaerobius fijiensis DSM 17918]|uniref:Predicted dehydrogenase n=1 Tax=Caldanaerobius fijiensis DSM 17918 TaxID=1121256 RepID=A0A1M5AYE1_9THEO|nr:Gfo/Idh/MocA family oxidoreductase [Caldanaerobius fijiensis]SHF35097.1 Predicted dehydrogenase [Caldanaerobius fijiensis DSM 17918]
MTEKIRIGLIGAGNICQNAHIPAYLKQDDVELVAVCDINEKRANEVKEKYGMKYAFTDFNDLVKLSDVDAVSVCTWNNAHAAATIAALNAGKHVLCEKPMAMNPEEAEAMIKAAKANNRILQIGFVNRFRADSKVIKEFAEKGRFGEIYFAKATYERRRGTPTGWFTNKAKSGGGPVIDIGVHVIDLTWYLMGKPKPVTVSAAVYDKIGDYKTKGVGRWHAFDPDDTFDTEDSACAFIRFENGATMQVSVSWALNNKESMNSEIFGTKAGASLSPFVIYDEQENYLIDSTPVVDREDPFYNEIKEFLTCIRENRTPIATGEDGLQIQKILNGIYESARLGKEIVL